MTTRLIASALLATLIMVTTSPRLATAEPAGFEIDPAHVTVAFLVRHIGYADTLGQFLEVEGGFDYDEATKTLSDLEVVIEAESVFSNHDRRDDHVRGSDFLDADEHPEIVFVGTGATPTGENSGTVTGDLTLLGVTRPVTLEVTLNKAGLYPFGEGPPYVLGISARTTIKRSAFGMTYAVENGFVGDEVDVIIELEAIRQ